MITPQCPFRSPLRSLIAGFASGVNEYLTKTDEFRPAYLRLRNAFGGLTDLPARRTVCSLLGFGTLALSRANVMLHLGEALLGVLDRIKDARQDLVRIIDMMLPLARVSSDATAVQIPEVRAGDLAKLTVLLRSSATQVRLGLTSAGAVTPPEGHPGLTLANLVQVVANVHNVSTSPLTSLCVGSINGLSTLPGLEDAFGDKLPRALAPLGHHALISSGDSRPCTPQSRACTASHRYHDHHHKPLNPKPATLTAGAFF